MTSRVVQKNGKSHHIMVSHAEAATHEGLHYTLLEHKKLAALGTFSVTFKVPAGYRAHFNYTINTGRETQLQVYENSVVTGTSKLARSRNQEFSKNLPPIIWLDGTVTTIGTKIADITWGYTGLNPVSPSAGGDGGESEFLIPSEKVLRFVVTSPVADNNVVIRMNWMIEKLGEY